MDDGLLKMLDFEFAKRSERIPRRFNLSLTHRNEGSLCTRSRNDLNHRTPRSSQYNDSHHRHICRRTRRTILFARARVSIELSLDPSPVFACNADGTDRDKTMRWRRCGTRR